MILLFLSAAFCLCGGGGFQEEIAVCEDLSKGGLSFRSCNPYPEASRVEVAVPFTPGTGAIFVPIRIVFPNPSPPLAFTATAPPTSSPPSTSNRRISAVGAPHCTLFRSALTDSQQTP